MKLRIKYVKEIPYGYIGMNFFAYEELFKKKYPYSKNIILILKGMPKARTRRTIHHERDEYALMEKGMKYHEAHIIANKTENVE